MPAADQANASQADPPGLTFSVSVSALQHLIIEVLRRPVEFTLYLYVQPTGARSWIQRLVIRGRRCELGLGAVALVSLAEAREQAVANRKLARAGGDPLADRRRVQGTPTFAEAATTVIDQKRAGWKTPAQVQAWRGSLERYAFPRIGRRPISEVASADVLAILTPIWHTKPVMAKTVKQRIHTVLEWAIAMNLRTDNPSDRVGPVLGPQRNIVQHMRALPHREVAAALATVRASGAPQAVTLAFEFLVLTAARSGEVRLAAWDEMDTAEHVWTIPATRMKMKRDHQVPLCGRARAILAAARTLGDGPLVFPGARRVKGRRGRGAYGKTVVFGIFARQGHVYTEIVPDCSKPTLQGIIRGRVDPRTVINSDGWRGYHGRVDRGYGHVHVDHARDEFTKGTVHINGIEGFWGLAKVRLTQFNFFSRDRRRRFAMVRGTNVDSPRVYLRSVYLTGKLTE